LAPTAAIPRSSPSFERALMPVTNRAGANARRYLAPAARDPAFAAALERARGGHDAGNKQD